MKAFASLALAIMICISVAASPAVAHGGTLVGLKKGDWIEYSISMTGPPLDSMRNLTGYRTEILDVDGGWLLVNKTALTVNGTLSSSVWVFNLTEGRVYGWVILTANLTTGETFFDSTKSANITIQGEKQKMLLGATRTVTYAHDPAGGYKEWDKATGVYVYSKEYTTNYTVEMNATATNMWNPQTFRQNQGTSYWLVPATMAVAAFIAFAVIFVFAKKRHLKKASKDRKNN